METELSGTPGTIKYIWDGGAEYSSGGKIFFGVHGVFLKESDDESFAGKTIFFPYDRIITITF